MTGRRVVVVALTLALLAVRPLGGAEAAPSATERRCGNDSNRVQLTFDDSADAGRVGALLDVLAAKQVRAGFFILGNWAASHPQTMARIRNEGHWLGNHSTTHPNLTRLPDASVRREIAGGVASELLRPPYGAFDGRIRAIAASAGYRLCLWDIDTSDWRGRSAAEIEGTVYQGLRPGAVVLLHLHGRNTLAALPGLIDGIRQRGYELDPLSRFSAATFDATSGEALLLERDGEVLAGPDGTAVVPALTGEGDAVALASRPAGQPGTWIATAGGGVHARGGAPFFGADGPLNAPLVGIASSPSGAGYWTVAADGGVFAHGDAGFFGSTGGLELHEPITALAATPSGQGYWLLGRDGGVFTFGDAAFFGSAAGEAAAPAFRAIAARPQSDGYWLLRADGAVRAFGAAAGVGADLSASTAGVARDGATFLGVAADADGNGYRLATDRVGVTYSSR